MIFLKTNSTQVSLSIKKSIVNRCDCETTNTFFLDTYIFKNVYVYFCNQYYSTIFLSSTYYSSKSNQRIYLFFYNDTLIIFSELLDFNLRRNYNPSGSLENVSHGHHDEEIYPHYHSVLSRHRTHRSMSNLEKEKPRKGKIIKEGIATMPTILDEETKEEVTRYKILIILNFTQFYSIFEKSRLSFFKFREKTPSDVSKCTESTEKILELHEDMAAVEGQEDQTADENDQGNSTKNNNFTKNFFISLFFFYYYPRCRH